MQQHVMIVMMVEEHLMNTTIQMIQFVVKAAIMVATKIVIFLSWLENQDQMTNLRKKVKL